MKSRTWVGFGAVIGVLVLHSVLSDIYIERNYGARCGETWSDFYIKHKHQISRHERVDRKNGVLRIIVLRRAPIRTIPSGPAVYVFDKDDRLDKFSLDVGDDKEVLWIYKEALDVLGSGY